MNFLFDESVSLAACDRLKELGHDVVHAVRAGLSGAPDQTVLEYAVAEKRVLVSRDYHFTNPVRFPTRGTPGIVYLRRGNLTSEQEAELLARFVVEPDLSMVSGHLVTVSLHETSVR